MLKINILFFIDFQKIDVSNLIQPFYGRRIADNEEGFAMAVDFITSNRKPKPIEKLKLKITTKSQVGTKPDNELLLKLTMPSPAIGKPYCAVVLALVSSFINDLI